MCIIIIIVRNRRLANMNRGGAAWRAITILIVSSVSNSSSTIFISISYCRYYCGYCLFLMLLGLSALLVL